MELIRNIQINFFITNEININKNIIFVSFIKGNNNLTKIDEISKRKKKIYISLII